MVHTFPKKNSPDMLDEFFFFFRRYNNNNQPGRKRAPG